MILTNQVKQHTVAFALGIGVMYMMTHSLVPKVHATATDHTQQEFDAVSVHTLRLVDPQGKPRMVIGAPLPDPYVGGKQYPRSSPVTGIQFLDTDGNEHGGIALIDAVHGAAVCFDYDTAEAMCMTKAGKYKGITLLDPPAKDAKLMSEGAQRLEMSDDDGHPRIALSDSKGKERLILSLDSKEQPQIEVLDENGKKTRSLLAHRN